MGSESDWHRGWLIIIGLIVSLATVALLGDAFLQWQHSSPAAWLTTSKPSEVFNYHVKETVLDGERVHEIEFSGFTGKQIVVEHPAIEKVGEGRFIFKDRSFLQTVKSDRPYVSATVPYKVLSGTETVRADSLDFYVDRKCQLTLESSNVSTWAKTFTVRGSAAPGAKVTVNGKPLKTTGSSFEYPVNLTKPGKYQYEFVASRAAEEPNKQVVMITRPPDYSVDEPPKYADTNLITFSGTVNPAFKVKINNLNILVRENGSFDHDLSLEEGKNKVLVQIANAQAQQVYSKTFYVMWEGVEKTYKRQAQTISYQQLKKDVKQYEGRAVKFYGSVLQMVSSGRSEVFRLGVGGSVTNVVMCMYLGSTDIVEGNFVTVYGPITGEYTYVSQAGWVITIPSMMVLCFD